MTTKLILKCKKSSRPTFLFGKDVWIGTELAKRNVNVKVFKDLAEATGLKIHTRQDEYVAFCERLVGKREYNHEVEKLEIYNHTVHMLIAYVSTRDSYFYKSRRELPCPFNTDKFDYNRVRYNNPI